MTIIKPDTVVRLCSNVPFSVSQDHVCDFTSVANQTQFFINRVKKSYLEFTYQREHQAVKVPTPIDDLYDVNYIMYQNRNYSDKWFYGFITRKEYVNPNTTAIYFEIDVYQTWHFEMKINPSYVIREHTKRWETNGQPVINTIDEGLDYGSEYETVSVQEWKPYDQVLFLVVVTKQAMHYMEGTSYVNKVKPSVVGYPQPLNYYVLPFKLDGTTPNINLGTTTGVDVSTPLEMLEGVYTQQSAVNNVVSIYVTEFIDGAITENTSHSIVLPTSIFEKVLVSDDTNLNFSCFRVKSLKSPQTMTKDFGNKYDKFYETEESKLLMYPYAVTVLSDLKGNQIELRNEYIPGTNLKITVRGSLGTSNKVSYQPENYLMRDQAVGNTFAPLQYALVNNDPNDVPILTDLLSAYLQGNKNTIQNQKNSIMWSALSSTMTGAIGGAIGGSRLGMLGAIGGASVGAVNTYFQLESYNAKQQDISNIPPSIANLGGNTSFDMGNDIYGLFIIKKQITLSNRDRLADFFKMYGYKINRLKIPNLRSRRNYNFIHTADIHITGDIPHDHLSKLKEIFNKGVTIWHSTDVGNYDLLNDEV